MKIHPTNSFQGFKFTFWLFLITTSLLVQGCFVPTSPRVHVDAPYRGMKSNHADTIRVLITHGIGPQNEKKGPFQLPLVEGVYKQMEGKKPKEIKQSKVIYFHDKSISLTIEEVQGNGKFYQFFSVSWYRYNQQRRDSFYCEDFDKRRFLASRIIKKKVMTGGLPDVIKYTRSDFQQTIQEPFIEAISRMFLKRTIALSDEVNKSILANENNQNNNSDFYFVTGSLGSKIVFDQLMAVIKEAQGIQMNPPQRTIHFFMLSNQLNLFKNLELSNKGVIPIPKSVRKSIKKINIVAFNDPNDLLAFHIPQHLINSSDSTKISISNVSLHNAKWHFPWVVSNLIKAHEGAKKNKKLHRYMVQDSVGIKGDFQKIKKNKKCP